MDKANGKQLQNVRRLLRGFALRVASKRGISLSKVRFDDGRPLGCRDMCILTLSARGKAVSTKICREEVDVFPRRLGDDLTRAKIRDAVERLQILINQ